MDNRFYLSFRHSDCNLHITMFGHFDGSAALALLNTIGRGYRAPGRVFIDTRKLHSIASSGKELLRLCTEQLPVPLTKIFFKGEQGFELAPSGTRVLIVSQRRKKHDHTANTSTGNCGEGCGGNCHGCHPWPTLRHKQLQELQPKGKAA